MRSEIDRIRDALEFVPVGGHDERVRVAFALKSELGDWGRQVWDEWRGGRGDDEADSVWRSAREDGALRIGSLFHEAKANGWHDDGGYRRPSPEELAECRRTAAERVAQQKAEVARQRVETARTAMAIMRVATEAKADHPYLMRKQVLPVPTLRETDASKVSTILGYPPASRGDLLTGRLLVVPVKQGDGISTLELIDGDGRKAALAGSGTKAGGYWATERLPDGDGAGLTLLLGEGVATLLSASAASGHRGIAALSSGNLPAVAKTMRDRYPAAALVILADLVKSTGEPDPKAIEAAQSAGGRLAVPDFGDNRDPSMKDFNDLAKTRGLEAVASAIAGAMTPEAVPPKPVPMMALAPPCDGWPDPKPLDREAALCEPFPLDALPGMVGAAVREYQAYGQQPIALVASSALAVVSLATQGLADVARDEQLTGPMSLNFLVVAQSGERKTAADKKLGAVLADWERERADAMREAIKRNRAELDAWTAEQEGLKAAIKAAMSKKPEEVEKLRKRLAEHALQKPAEIVAPRLRYEDVNPQSLAFMLAAGHPSAALWSDEGGMVTGSQGMGKDSLLGFMAGLNRLWDGGAIHHDRKQAQSVHLEGRRLTVSLMVQPAVLRELTQRGGGLTRGSGFLARYLVTAPASTMGTRLYREPPRGMPYLAAFHKRIRELLDTKLPVDDQGRLRLPLISLSSGAFSVWRDYHDEIERELRALGDFATVCDFAAKSAENAARIAGCLHTFERGQGAIPHETMHRAVALARWYLRESLRVLEVLDEPQEWTDARLLDAWLAEAGDSPTRDVLRLGPGPLRDKGRRNAAIDVLADLGRARIERDGRRETLVRNPAISQFATATPATPATGGGGSAGTVAEVATVAVADGWNPEIERGEL